MVAAGAAVNAGAEDGRTALRMAAMEGHTAIVQQLMNAGAEVNAANLSGVKS